MVIEDLVEMLFFTFLQNLLEDNTVMNVKK
jgi:hypothetical protein